MRVLVDYNEKDRAVEEIQLVSASYVSNFVIHVQFSDGLIQNIDFKPFLQKSQHPSIKKYLDESIFANFQIVDGNLNWNDYDLIFPLWDLYNGEIK